MSPLHSTATRLPPWPSRSSSASRLRPSGSEWGSPFTVMSIVFIRSPKKGFRLRILRSIGVDQPLEQRRSQMHADADLLQDQRARRIDQRLGDLDVAVDRARG